MFQNTGTATDKQYFTLSDIHKIAPKLVNPHAKEAEQTAKRLCAELGIHLDDKFDGYNTMSAYLYPTASKERLIAIIMMMNMLYFIDEVYDRHARDEVDAQEDLYLRRVFDNCVPILLRGEMPANDDHVLYQPCLVIYNIVSPLVSENWMKRLVFSMLQHLKSTTYTLDDILQTKGGDPIEQYIMLRELDCGMRPAIDMAELALGIYLPDEVKQSDYIESIEYPTALIGGLMNDIFSYEKEVVFCDSRFNLVAILQDYRYLSFDEAVHESVCIVNKYTDDYLERAANIPDFGSPEMNRMVELFVEGMGHQINATWYWQLSTDRYCSPTSPFPELRLTH
ncbi:MAG: terpene synthase family protein [Aggregatilineales bacterium]